MIKKNESTKDKEKVTMIQNVCSKKLNVNVYCWKQHPGGRENCNRKCEFLLS